METGSNPYLTPAQAKPASKKATRSQRVERKIQFGWVAGLLWGFAWLGGLAWSLVGRSGAISGKILDPVIVAAIFGATFGVFRKSRVAALLLALGFAGNLVAMGMAGRWIAFALSAPWLICFILGGIGTFQFHRGKQ